MVMVMMMVVQQWLILGAWRWLEAPLSGPRRLRLTLICSFSNIILDSDSIKTLGRE